MPVAGGIALLAVGAIFTFALTGSIQGIDLHVVGVILMLAGALGLLLPSLVRSRIVAGSGRGATIADGTAPAGHRMLTGGGVS